MAETDKDSWIEGYVEALMGAYPSWLGDYYTNLRLVCLAHAREAWAERKT